jgi:hypothetical protein
MTDCRDPRINIDAIAISQASLCEDCRMIVVSRNESCPLCGSKAVMNLATILAGQKKSEKELDKQT